MKHFLSLFLAIFIFSISTNLAISGPTIMLDPKRVEFTGKQRSSHVMVINNGDSPGRFQMEIIVKRMDKNGVLRDVKDEDLTEEERIAKQIIRVSPRRVTINSRKSQIVRLFVRKPATLPEGEYRARLFAVVKPLVDDDSRLKNRNKKDNKLQIKLKANLGVTIPIIIEHGELFAKGNIQKVNLVNEDIPSAIPTLNMTISREGNKSLYGDLEVIYVQDNQEYVLKTIKGLAIYNPNKERNLEIPLEIPEGVFLKKSRSFIEKKRRVEAKSLSQNP
jgi:hypothetical protein